MALVAAGGWTTRAIFMLASSMACGGASLAQGAGDFYKGRTVTLYIGGTAGGGIDLAARIVARHLGNHIAGSPSITPQLLPGAGGIRLIDTIATSSPKDGSVIGVVPAGPLLDPLIGGRKTPYKMTDLNALGAYAKDFSLCVAWATTPFKTIDDVRKQTMTVAGTGAAATPDTFPLVLNATLGTKFKVITGYLGTMETVLAIERGETHGRCGWSWSSLKGIRLNWVQEKKINLLLQMGVEKSPLFPDVPSAIELATTEADKQMLKLMFSSLQLSNAFLAPPGVPAERVAELRKGLAGALADPELRKESAAQLGDEPSPTTGEDMQRLIGEMYATPEPVVDRLKAILKH